MILWWYSKSLPFFWKSCFQLLLISSHLWRTLPAWAFPQLSMEKAAAPLRCVVLACPCLQWALLPSSVSISADCWIRQQKQEQNKNREVTYTTAQREKRRGSGEREIKTMTPSACGHRGHISQMGNEWIKRDIYKSGWAGGVPVRLL